HLEGRTLRQWMDQRSRGSAPALPERDDMLPWLTSPSLVIDLMIPVVRALSCAHKQGLVHRDLKPSNIFLTDAGKVVVLDFGIAKQRDAHELSMVAAFEEPLAESAEMTQAGVILGTMPYMSPEQWRAEDLDARSDLWAVGIILYQLITGTHPLRPRALRRYS